MSRLTVPMRSLVALMAVVGGALTCRHEQLPGPDTPPVDLHRIESGLTIGAGTVLGSGEVIQDVLSAESGEVAFVDVGSHQIVIVAPEGQVVTRIGREGSGPGEFRSMSLVAFWGDSLAVYDAAQRRLTILRRDGTAIRQERVESSGLVAPMVIGFGRDGRPVLRGTSIGGPVEGSPLVTVRGVVQSFAPSGSADTIAIFDDGLWHPRGPRFFSWRGTATMVDSGIWVGAGGRPELTMVRFDGSTERVLRWSAATRPVTASDQVKVVEVAKGRRAASDLTGDDRFADSIPYFGLVLSDPLGGLWVIGSAAPFEAPDSAWRIDEEARTIQGLPLPPRFRPTQVGNTFLLGVRSDEEGSRQVMRYELSRCPEPGCATVPPPPASMP